MCGISEPHTSAYELETTPNMVPDLEEKLIDDHRGEAPVLPTAELREGRRGEERDKITTKSCTCMV